MLKLKPITRATLIGIATLASSTTHSLTLDVQGNNAVPNEEGGDTLLFPTYTVGNGTTAAMTSFSLTNQSSETNLDTIAIKIRFREQEHGMDAVNFLVIMSPFDKFTFWIAPGANGRPKLEWDDNTCVVGPPLGQHFIEFPAHWAPFVNSDTALSVGYVEVLGLAALNQACVNATTYEPIMWSVAPNCVAAGGIGLAAAATHNATTHIPANCAVLSGFFSNPSKVRMANENSNGNGISDWAYPTFLPVPNTLVGRYAITISDQGIESGGNAIAIQNANITHGSTNPAKYGGDFVGLVTAQSTANCSVNGNCMSKYAWDQQEYAHPHLGEMANLANLQRLMGAASLNGHWVTNPANAVNVDWVISFPTKYAYMDFLSGAWTLLANTKTSLGRPGAWVGANSTDLKLSSVNPHLYGTEEQDVIGTAITFSNEVNILSLANAPITWPSLIQTEDRRIKASFNGPAVNRGWAKLPLTWRGVGDAVTGLILTTRNTGNAQNNNGAITGLRAIPQLIQSYTLQITKVGTGTGLVTSGPAGINCGTDCAEAYREGTMVTLTAIPTNGYFIGWSGDPDCTDGQVTITSAKNCTATFGTPTPDFVVTSIVLNPATPKPNTTFAATVTVKNQGSSAGDGKFLDVWTNQTTALTCGATGTQRQTVGVLAANATKALIFAGLNAGTAANKMFGAFVDSGCGTVESNEQNNQVTQAYTVQ